MLRVVDAIRHMDDPIAHPILAPEVQQKLADTAAMLKESHVAALLGVPSIATLGKDWQAALKASTAAATAWSNLKADHGTTGSKQCDAKAISPELTIRAIELVKHLLLPSLETPTLTKAELAELLFERLGLNKRESKDMVEAFFDLIHATLVSGDDVKMSGFGNFNIRRKAPRPGRNPRTGEAIPIKARNVVTFHASHKLKGVVQGDIPPEEDFE